MSRHTFPDGEDTVIEYAPDALGEVPPAAAVDVLHRAVERLDTTASFIPAVHGADPVSVAGRRVAQAFERSRVRQTPDFWAAIEHLVRVAGEAS